MEHAEFTNYDLLISVKGVTTLSNQEGLTGEKAKELQLLYGKNEIKMPRTGKIGSLIKHIISEPIYLLLSCAAVIYFLLGEATEGTIMIAFVVFVIGIDVIQDNRTGKTLDKLKEMTTPSIKVIRDHQERMISSIDIVPGDLMMISEGVKVPADGYLISTSGLCIDESILTGEAEGVWKEAISSGEEEAFDNPNCFCYAGTMVTLGNGSVIVTKIGNNTEYGKIANNIVKTKEEQTLMQKQMNVLAKQCTMMAAILFLLVSGITFLNLSYYPMLPRIIESILAGLVLALSMVPGEFPVIQSVFLTMGALRLAKKKALIRRLPVVETLGAISVLCVDKTGTITENNMVVNEFWTIDHRKDLLCRAMTLSCKRDTYDPMEKAMLSFCDCFTCKEKQQKPSLLKACSFRSKQPLLMKEYAFTNELKAMGQVWKLDHECIIAAKGCPETILSLCEFEEEEELQLIYNKVKHLTRQGLRLIAVADKEVIVPNELPNHLLDCKLKFRGLIGLYDPPRSNISEYIKEFHKAGIRVIMLTGDHRLTAVSIAELVGIPCENVLTGDELERLSKKEIREKVADCDLFVRVMPMHKRTIVKALKENGEIVAMIGDGVNDSPALKMADIGIAMGQKGAEVSREAADFILLDDNINTVLHAVEDGRRIYHNIKKAVGYVLSIHLPIALSALVAPLMGILPEALLLLPLHIVLLELVMDPTCSVALERQPAEEDIMLHTPRSPKEKLMCKSLFIKSILQGVSIFLFSFLFYYWLLKAGYGTFVARSAGFSSLVLSNIFLVMENCSGKESIIKVIKKCKKDKGIWAVSLLTFLGLLFMIYSPISLFLKFSPLTKTLFLLVIGSSACSVFWFEVVKLFIRNRNKG